MNLLSALGPPGTGKTTFGLELVKSWKRDLAPEEIGYLAFTRAAASEAVVRVGGDREAHTWFRTLHSLCYRLLRASGHAQVMLRSHYKQFAEETGMDGTYTVDSHDDLAEVYLKLEGGGKTDWDRCRSAYMLSRLMARTTDDLDRAREEVSNAATQRVGLLYRDQYRAFVKAYDAFRAKNGLVDFTDMLEWALRYGSPPPVRRVIIDECQDLAPIHHSILNRLFHSVEEMWMIGDDDQCQPSDTWVRLANGGWVQIGEIRAGMKVRSWSREEACMVPREVEEIASRPYLGKLFWLSASGNVTEATRNHRFVIRWRDRKTKNCVTYLMRRGNRFRIGWCQLFNSDGALHLNVRARAEKADATWVLKAHENRTDASVYESIVAARYGIPMAPFEPVNGATHLNRKAIDAIFDGVGDREEAAITCLFDHGRSIEYPLIDLGIKGRWKSTIMKVACCNLMPSEMLVPVPDGRSVKWVPFKIGHRFVSNVTVHSLKVKGTGTYVANGIVTHNSIFRFSGASAEEFLAQIAGRPKVVLRQTHRFGQGIVDFSAKIIRRVENRIEKGVIGLDGHPGGPAVSYEFKPRHGRYLILHRHVDGCRDIASSFMTAGIPFSNERGKDPLSSANRVKAWLALSALARGQKVPFSRAKYLLEGELPSTHITAEEEKIRIMPRGAKKKLDNVAPMTPVDVDELVKRKLLTENGAHAVRKVDLGIVKHEDDLRYYEKLERNGYQLTKDGAPTITTIHGSKGRQAPYVVVFTETSRRCWEDSDSEHRLAYVAATRTQGDVDVCEERRVDWASAPYSYPLEA